MKVECLINGGIGSYRIPTARREMPNGKRVLLGFFGHIRGISLTEKDRRRVGSERLEVCLHEEFTQAGDAGVRCVFVFQPRKLFAFEADFQGCTKACGKLSEVILPVCFLGKIAALAPARTEII